MHPIARATWPRLAAIGVGLCALAAPPAAASQRQDPKARGIFLAGGGEASRLGVKFWIALKRGETLQDVQTTETFRSGDAFKLRFESNMDGFAYVFQEGTTGRRSLLFPLPQDAGANRVAKFATVAVPPGTAYFQFDQNPGMEKVYLIVSRRPVADIESILRGTPGASNPPVMPPKVSRPAEISAEENAVLSQLLSRGLKRTERDVIYHPETTPAGAQATYAVDTGDDNAEPIVLKLDLDHK